MMLKESHRYTYLIKEAKSIKLIYDKIQELHDLALIPNEDGLALGKPPSLKKAQKRLAAAPLPDLNSKKTRKGRPKKKFSGRVSSKADMMKRTYQTKLKISAEKKHSLTSNLLLVSHLLL